MPDYYVYLLSSRSRVLYVGVTNDLMRRVLQHKRGDVPGFTRTYRVTRLVYAERTSDVRAAIWREKQLKRWPRHRKERLVEVENPEWEDLAAAWFTPEMLRAPG
jgi:putative endonuclease